MATWGLSCLSACEGRTCSAGHSFLPGCFQLPATQARDQEAGTKDPVSMAALGRGGGALLGLVGSCSERSFALEPHLPRWLAVLNTSFLSASGS